eukprot:3624814-Prymnesium_polylepis.1
MSNDSTLSTNEQQLSIVKNVPVDIDGDPIRWPQGSNPAYLEGILFEVGEYYTRTNAFVALIEEGAVQLPSGKMAVDTVSGISFVAGLVSDPEPYTFLNPCPPTPARIATYDAARDRAGLAKFTAPASVPDDVASSYMVAKYAVKKEDNDLMNSLLCVVVDTDVKQRLLAACGGSGRALIELLKSEARKATAQDRTLISSKLTKFISKGLQGDLTLVSFNVHFKEYNKLVRNKPPATRPSEEETMEMLIAIMHRDHSIRELFELKLKAKQPADIHALTELIRSTLRSRLVAGEIDEVASDSAPLAALTAAQITALEPLPATMHMPQVAASLRHAKQQQALLA